MLGPNIMTKQNPGMKGVMLHFLVLRRMKLNNLMPLIWLMQVPTCPVLLRQLTS
ncbi:hypothetical protein Ahy_A06g027476 isoform A [Arachis hypogaea]|uniref:Uncharacterized protein n=1 Tax=Arachis hypogaea TaxID=3818 RepID=A0A445CNS9_ARAHY|nr:hypothetical protein Ahy_A06g027476 isoform A [Arachis hypogaea]